MAAIKVTDTFTNTKGGALTSMKEGLPEDLAEFTSMAFEAFRKSANDPELLKAKACCAKLGQKAANAEKLTASEIVELGKAIMIVTGGDPVCP